MVIDGKHFPLIGVWTETRQGVHQCFSTAYLDDASYDTAHRHAMRQLRDGAMSVSLRAYALDHYPKAGGYVPGRSHTMDILDYRALPENAKAQEAFYLDC